MIEFITLGASSFLVAEILGRTTIRAVITLQSLRNSKINLRKLSKKVSRKSSSNVVIGFGNKTFYFHHSMLGWILVGTSVAFSSISMLGISLGLISHHLIRERKLFW